jgi:hypothetical protein
MPSGLIQIWLNTPIHDIQETIQAVHLGGSLFQVREIPFASTDVSFMDVVRCEDKDDAPRLQSEVVRRSGNRTMHMMFADRLHKNTLREYLLPILQMDVTYRRSGFRAFSLNIPPHADYQAIADLVDDMRLSGAMADGDRGDAVAAELADRNLQYLTGKTPNIQDGATADPELFEGSIESPP